MDFDQWSGKKRQDENVGAYFENARKSENQIDKTILSIEAANIKGFLVKATLKSDLGKSGHISPWTNLVSQSIFQILNKKAVFRKDRPSPNAIMPKMVQNHKAI